MARPDYPRTAGALLAKALRPNRTKRDRGTGRNQPPRGASHTTLWKHPSVHGLVDFTGTRPLGTKSYTLITVGNITTTTDSSGIDPRVAGNTIQSTRRTIPWQGIHIFLIIVANARGSSVPRGDVTATASLLTRRSRHCPPPKQKYLRSRRVSLYQWPHQASSPRRRRRFVRFKYAAVAVEPHCERRSTRP